MLYSAPSRGCNVACNMRCAIFWTVSYIFCFCPLRTWHRNLQFMFKASPDKDKHQTTMRYPDKDLLILLLSFFLMVSIWILLFMIWSHQMVLVFHLDSFVLLSRKPTFKDWTLEVMAFDPFQARRRIKWSSSYAASLRRTIFPWWIGMWWWGECAR